MSSSLFTSVRGSSCGSVFIVEYALMYSHWWQHCRFLLLCISASLFYLLVEMRGFPLSIHDSYLKFTDIDSLVAYLHKSYRRRKQVWYLYLPEDCTKSSVAPRLIEHSTISHLDKK